MDFCITVEQMELANAVRDYLSDNHGPEILRRLDAGPNRDPAIWQGLTDMGLTGLLIPEDLGGLGLGLVDAALIARECGRACLAEPLVESAYVAVPWLLTKGIAADWEAVLAGRKRPLPAHRMNGWMTDGDGPPLKSVDPLRNLSALLDDASSDEYLLNVGALMSAAQLIGLAEALLNQAVEYSKIREQFGQAVGGFQALKHKLADVAVALEFARPVVWRAADALQEGLDSAAIHISHAKYAATDAANLAAESAIQVHGAMGYTYEVDLHFWMKRVWALSGAWGSRAFHLSRVEAAIIGGSHIIGPEHTFA